MIGEFASAEAGGSKAEWMRDAAARIASPDYAQIRAFVWFNMNKETDWRVESTQPSLDAFRASFVTGPALRLAALTRVGAGVSMRRGGTTVVVPPRRARTAAVG
jgi:hypothetical protein